MSMITTSVITQKGGAGKTTLLASLAVAAAETGEKVIALDLDPQASLATWGNERAAETLDIDRVGPDQLPNLKAILQALEREGYTYAFLDTAGVANASGAIAMAASDLILVPARPSRIDILATMSTIEAAIGMGMRDRFAFVLNQCPPGRNSRAGEAGKGLSLLGLLAEPTITQRADHQDALATGQGVTEYAPDGKAADEIRALWQWVQRKTKGKQG